MDLRVKFLGLEAGCKPIVILNTSDAEDLGVRSLGRVKLRHDGKESTAIVNTTHTVIKKGVIGVYECLRALMDLKDNDVITVETALPPISLEFIKNKLRGRKLTFKEIEEIVKDAVEGNLSEVELTSFVTALHNFGLDLDEATSLSMAMVKTGETLKLDRKVIVDKHSIGGVPGDKTTLLVVPIIASFDLTIPKTSSRAITSAAGSADRAEVLMPVNLDLEEMVRVVEKTNGCMVWGGSLHLAPADDIFVQVEYPLAIDPLLMPSIMSKKKAVGATHLVIDIPTGRGTKVKTIGDANLLAKDFIELGKKLSITTSCAITYGEQPIGYAIGPALEAREALENLMRKTSTDLVDKATHISGILLEMMGHKNGQKLALESLKSGKAEQKLREIISEQGGNPKIKPEDIEIGKHDLNVRSEKPGYVLWIDNTGLVELARAAGAPKDKGAGIILHKKPTYRVGKGEKLLTVYAENAAKLQRAQELLEEEVIIKVGDRMEMLIDEVKEVPVHEKAFILER